MATRLHRWRATVGVLSGISILFLSITSCVDTFQTNATDGQPAGEGAWLDPGYGQCTPGQDSDQDRIPDEVEGCGTDTDGDQIPDPMDTDADGDKVLDAVEAGPDPKAPRDSDGDKVPDFQDTDSDDDGLSDGAEDLDGDGKLGCCLTSCGEQREGCPPAKPDQCGKGQSCGGGTCQPPAHFLCSDGETDPLSQSTFPDGLPDKDLPTFVCHKPGETSSKGLKPMKLKQSATGGWHVALEASSTYGEVAIDGATPPEAGATFDLSAPDIAVAGFIVSLPAAGSDLSKIAGELVAQISAKLPGKADVSQLVSGTARTSHDGYPTVVGTQLALWMAAPADPPTVRNSLLPLLLNRSATQVTKLPQAGFGPAVKELVLAFQTLLRPTEGRVLVMGAVAGQAMVKDAAKNTAFHLDDLSNGTGLATLLDTDTVECDPFVLESSPVADIIWVVDESGSMDDNRQDIVNNATDFFARALKSGLDFRMGVASMKDPHDTAAKVKVGKLCSKASADKADDGGADRFLSSSEQTIFKACIQNPPYEEPALEYGLAHAYEAVVKHLPRKPASANDPTKIREEATLVVIIATDESPQELKYFNDPLFGSVKGSWKGKDGFLDEMTEVDILTCSSAKQAQIDAYVQPWIDLFQGKDPGWGAQGEAIVHLIGGVCKKQCGAYGPDYPWGYQEIVNGTGGQVADICQKNLGTTLQLIIDSITGAASPSVLEYVPISASLAVALGDTQLQRSRTQGFDYSSASNSLVLVGIPFKKGEKMVASYRRWVKQGGFLE